MFSIEKNNLSDIFYQLAVDHMHYGKRIQSRGSTRFEIPGYRFSLHDPRQNILMVPFRYNNPPAIIAETLWVFAGRIDMDYLTFYLKNAIKYSDDGETWRGGYGKRLRNYVTLDDDGKHQHVEQIDRVLAYLNRDRYTTRAVLVIPDGSDYQLNKYGEERIDEPCTMFVQYLCRDGGLHCFVNMRSNDVVLGCFNVNLFEWTFLQALLANEISTTLGSYTVQATSMHIYDDWVKRLPLIMETRMPFDMYSIVQPKRITMNWTQFKQQLPEVIQLDLVLRNLTVKSVLATLEGLQKELHSDLFDCFCVMACQHFMQKSAPQHIKVALQKCSNEVYCLACLEWLARRLGRPFDSLIDSIAANVFSSYSIEKQQLIQDYVYHSRERKAALDKLNNVRSKHESYRQRKVGISKTILEEG